jgi:hypothetical protein
MGVTERKIREYVCDRCGFKTDEPEADRGGEETLTRRISRYGYDGSLGGATEKLWLCSRCSEGLDEYLKSSVYVRGLPNG